jgi:gamma-glutamyl:cysteine ligase YbdK (ATP-grasp superfamily)
MIYVEIKTCDKVLRVCNKLFENVPTFLTRLEQQ